MLAQRLKMLRKYHHLTQAELAQRINTTKTTISNYENDYSSPSIESLCSLADVLHTTTDFLVGRNAKSLQEEQAAFPYVSYWYNELEQCSTEELIALQTVWKTMKNLYP